MRSTQRMAGGSPLGIAILGSGNIAQRHAHAFAQLGSQAQIIGAADLDLARAERLASAYGGQAYGDYRALLDRNPDIAVICLPHRLHHEAGLRAAEVGSHVLMEKPLANTIEDAQAVIKACQQKGVRLTVGFVHRYRAEWQLARQLIDRGDLGRLTMAIDVFGMRGGVHVPGWVWGGRQTGGGILMFSGIHSIDWQCWLMGSDVREVYASSLGFRGDSDAESSVVASWLFANGAHGTLIGNQPGYLVTPRTREFELYGTYGRIRVRNAEFLEFSSEDLAYRMDVKRDDPFVSQAREFVAAIREDREPWITGADGLRALAEIL